MKVLCIDDTKRPRQISEENWIKEGQTYTVKTIEKLRPFGGIGYTLQEVEFPPYYVPAIGIIGSYRSERFVEVSGDKALAREEAALEVHMDELYK